MSKIRRALVLVAVSWLMVHVSVLTATTALLVATGSAAADIVCTCTHGADHTACPMHHQPVDSARCHLQSTQRDLGNAPLSMVGPLTLPVVIVDLAPATSSPLATRYDTARPVDWTAPPDAPPPRS